MALSRGVFKSRKFEPTIPLIDVVFHILVFVLVAGTLARPVDRSLKLVTAADIERLPPPSAIVAYPDGRLAFRGLPTTAAHYVATIAAENAAKGDDSGPLTVRILPDRDLPAAGLLATIAQLRGAGATRVLVIALRSKK